jgi:hypothetical protein
MKKHISQMKPSEVRYLVDRFRNIPQMAWEFTPYAKARCKERGFDPALFRTFWTSGFDLIEYHNCGVDHRVLLRSIESDSEGYQLCVSFSLTMKRVKTVYKNYKHYKHENLDESNYDGSLDIKKLIKGRVS